MKVPLLRLEHVSKSFSLKGKRKNVALHDVSLDIWQGESLGVVGESGCGKSTLAKMIMGVYPKVEGSIYFHGQPLHLQNRKARLAFAEKAQMIFQDPYSALNPRMKVGDIVAENLAIHRRLPQSEKKQSAQQLLEMVGLPAASANRFPSEFSGGQRQRIGIARALAIRPELLVCDEPISALDVSIQSQIMNLLKRLGQELGLTYLFIAHDLAMVRYISSRVAVMYRGHVVELAGADMLYERPLHPYTQLLLQAVLTPDLSGREKLDNSGLQGEVPRFAEEGVACPFTSRCPQVKAQCMSEKPELRECAPGHFVACHQMKGCLYC